MTSHSDAPTRSKRIPARARRYCPVIVHVHWVWIAFILWVLYIRRVALSPRDGYRPGEAAVNLTKRHPSTEVTTIVTQVVINVKMVRCQTSPRNGPARRSAPNVRISAGRK